MTLAPRHKDWDAYFAEKAEFFGDSHLRLQDPSQWWANAFILCNERSEQVMPLHTEFHDWFCPSNTR